MPSQTLKEKEAKSKTITKFQAAAQDTGGTEVQVALLTGRILELTDHLRTHKKDYSSQRGLLKLVGQRRRLLDYLKGRSASRYLKLINELELRK
jgi:small subunit ribosomal protein S15